MSKLQQNETQVWASAYGLALALLTLGTSIHRGFPDTDTSDLIELRAQRIADQAVKTLKKKGVI